VVDAFLLASRTGDLAGLLAVLDPNAVLRADAQAVVGSAASTDPHAPRLDRELRGASSVAGAFNGRAQAAQPALVNGGAGAVWAPGGTPRVAFDFTVKNGVITRIEVVADPAHLSGLELQPS
jgi:ketosteroid isomerase-like protein